MKITKRQLKRIIKEERKRILSEAWGEQEESMSPILSFAQAWSSLGGAVQEQVASVVNAQYNYGGGDRFMDVVYEQNPNAIEVAIRKLTSPLRDIDTEDAEDILFALQSAQSVFEEGDEEVKADAKAAGDL